MKNLGMKRPLLLSILILSVVFLMGMGGLALADELFKASHGGEMVRHLKTGLAYEVVRKPKEVLLYAPDTTSPVPSTLSIRFKNEKGIMDRVDVKLIPVNEPGSIFYSAPLPERVLVAAGLTFYIN